MIDRNDDMENFDLNLDRSELGYNMKLMTILTSYLVVVMLVVMMVLTKLYILARSFGAESSRVQANCITWPTWIPASWFEMRIEMRE